MSKKNQGRVFLGKGILCFVQQQAYKIEKITPVDLYILKNSVIGSVGVYECSSFLIVSTSLKTQFPREYQHGFKLGIVELEKS